MTAVADPGFLATKAAAIRAARAGRDEAADVGLRRRCASLSPAPSLERALRAGAHVAVIAEYKRRSPSAGVLAAHEDPGAVAAAYRAGGAAGVSVLTDGPDFDGSLDDLEVVAGAVPGLPVLRKDFTIDAGQLLEARAAGASAALLITGILDDAELAALVAGAAALRLECLVEVHTEAELDRAVSAGARLIGINNRDLRRLETDLAVTERLAPLAPADATLVSESGIRSADDVRRVRDAGVHGVLVGESLLRLLPAQRLEQLRRLAAVAR
jgi:indole-3-glycerol phosphate synthase